MKPKKYTRITKCATRAKINKKNARKSNRLWGFNNNISVSNLENINEILRVRKTQRAEGNDSFKLVPKDSCEVYKERRKKQQRSQDVQREKSFSEDSQKRPKRDKTRPRKSDKQTKKKTMKNVRKKKRKPRSDSSATCCSSMSTVSYDSCSSTSDMKY